MTSSPPAPVAVDLPRSYLLFNHGPVTLVSTAAGGQRNVMAASWAMPLDFDPPKVAVVVDGRSFTRELLEASGEFVLNIPCLAQATQVLAVGECSGRDTDKFAAHGLSPLPASRVGAPLIAGCVAWLECKVLPERAQRQTYDLVLGEVVAAWADPTVFHDQRWDFTDPQRRTLHYVAGGSFFVTGETLSLGD